MRTLTADTVEKIGETVILNGWIDKRRDHGGIMFLDLRDRTGIVQIVSSKKLANVRPEDCVEVEGVIKKRPENMVNSDMRTGTVEVDAMKISLLSKSADLPFPIDDDGYDIKEDIRLKYRYLDLRRKRLADNIRLRSRFVDLVRQELFREDFTEIETPLLTKSTPEGSRDFIVPSRIQPGKFFALPQSPQQYKQLLMVAGFERYFQIARCLRDEDLRRDRGFEHTQIDLEMSFVTREDVMKLDEQIMTNVVQNLGYKIKHKPFPVYHYKDAVGAFGADKFDLRTEKEKKEGILAFAWVINFPFFEKDASGGWTFTHNPFSAPIPTHHDWLLKKEHIGDILTSQYDLVCNGFEVGGGSIRSHDPDILTNVFEIIGHSKENIEKQFGHMIEAFRYGVPPHGGIAHGIERLLMTLTGEEALREVVAFPQTAGGSTSVMDAPSTIDEKQLEELGIQTIHLKDGHDVFKKIITDLENNHVKFSTYEHGAVTTSLEAAQVRKTPVSWGAKAILMYGDGKPVMVVVAGDTKIDTKAFKIFSHMKDVRMATRDEVKQITGVEVGAVPPLGAIFGIPVFMDKQIEKNDTVVFNAGLHTHSISLSRSDYVRYAQPIIGTFSKPI